MLSILCVCVRESIFDQRIYVTIKPPYLQFRGVIDSNICAFNKTKIETWFSNRNSLHTNKTKHVHQAQYNKHTHQAQHFHHRASMYSKIFTCTYCGRNGHLAKCCYNKLNLKERNI